MVDLFKIADDQGIEVVYSSLPKVLSASAQCGESCMVGLDYSLLWGGVAEREHLAHELGHCCSGAFYNLYSPHDIRAKHEARANRWAIRQLVPPRDIVAALEHGCCEAWQMAEYIGVSPELLSNALELYREESFRDLPQM